jgi:hypothetical protein
LSTMVVAFKNEPLAIENFFLSLRFALLCFAFFSVGTWIGAHDWLSHSWVNGNSNLEERPTERPEPFSHMANDNEQRTTCKSRHPSPRPNG